jgi:hypothetical protein
MKIIYIMFFCMVLLGCKNTVWHKPYATDKEIFYIAKNGSMVDVFNISWLHFSVESISYLEKKDFKYGEFGGQIEFCSNDEYYCLSGGINIAIPKKILHQRDWQFLGRECHVDKELSVDQNNTVSCKLKNLTLQFVYSSESGVVSYIRSSGMEYNLLGGKGLFARNPE